MLPPGHVAAGFLTAHAMVKVLRPDLTAAELQQFLLLGAFFGFAPDLDTFVAFAKVKSLTFEGGVKDSANHRKFVSHAPVLWLLAGLLVYGFADGEFAKLAGLLLWLASWSHFLLDTIQYGIMWLWPVRSEIYAMLDRGVSVPVLAHGFWGYWWGFLKSYSRKTSFYLELLIIAIAAVVLFANYI